MMRKEIIFRLQDAVMLHENTQFRGNIAPFWDHFKCTAGEWMWNKEGFSS